MKYFVPMFVDRWLTLSFPRAGDVPEHGSIEFFHKVLFAEFKRKGVWIEQRLLKKYPGSYDALWRARMANASKHRPDYARLPNQAIVDIDEERKLRAVHWDLSEFNNLINLFVFRGMKIFILRASKEVSVPLLSPSSFDWLLTSFLLSFFLFCHSRLAKPRGLRFEDFNLNLREAVGRIYGSWVPWP
jgi:hypothetical protein